MNDINVYVKMSFLMLLKSKVRYLFKRAELDKAVFFGLLTKAWSMVAGLITILLILNKFTPELQGYYYTFITLLAFQAFVELGLGTVIVQFASHEWSKLGFDKSGRIVGDKDALSRLASLAVMALKWYAVASVIFIFGLGLGGYIFFSTSPNLNINWALPWFTLCLFTGVAIFLVPIWSLLEGCNQVGNLYTNRFQQSLFSNIAIWIAILLGAKLWTTTISILVSFICAGIFVITKYKLFFKTLFSGISGSVIDWRREVFPMQWRMALTWVSGYFISSFFVPVLFKFHGAKVAGQMGLTLTATNAVSAIYIAWISSKVPRFGMLVARRAFKELDELFWKLIKIIFFMSTLIAIVIFVIVYAANLSGHPFAARLLSPLPVALLLIAAVIGGFSYSMSYYIMAHKKMPIMFISIIAGTLSVLATSILGKHYAATGIVIGYLFVICITCALVTIIWYHCRIEWHKDKYSATEILGKDVKIKETLI